MKQRKYLSKICALLFLTCVLVVPAVHAENAPPDGISQQIGVGFKVLAGDAFDGTAIGANARFWTESNFGFEVGWVRDSGGVKGSSEGVSVGVSAHFDVIPVSALYTLTHVDTESVYIRPYVGAGFNIARLSASVSVSGYGESASASDSATKVGGQGFAGAEFTFKQVPKLSFGGDIGIHRFAGDSGFAVEFQVHYYLK